MKVPISEKKKGGSGFLLVVKVGIQRELPVNFKNQIVCSAYIYVQ